MDDVFADLTNEDPEAEPIENLHASEALEALDASNGSSREPSPTEESIPTATATATAPAAAVSAEEEDAPAAKSPIVETTEDPESEL
jgi:histone demethylase JARID1